MNASSSFFRRFVWLAGTTSAFAVASAACSSSPSTGAPTPQPDSGAAASDSGAGAFDGGSPEDGGAPADSSTGSDVVEDAPVTSWPSVPTSNTPAATFTNSTTGSSSLVLVSLNFEQSVSGTQEFQELYAEIGNSGPGPACFAQLTVNYLDAGGNTLATFHSYADGDEYEMPGDSLMVMANCFAQGTSAGLYDNNFAPAAIDLSTVAKVTYTFSQLASPGVEPAPGAPVIESSVLSQDPSWWTVTGNIQAQTTVYNLETLVYGVGPDGLIASRGEAINLGTLTQGSMWMYTAQPISMPVVSRYLQNLTYLDGMCTTCSRRPPEPPAVAPNDVARARGRMQEARARSDANTARFVASQSR